MRAWGRRTAAALALASVVASGCSAGSESVADGASSEAVQPVAEVSGTDDLAAFDEAVSSGLEDVMREQPNSPPAQSPTPPEGASIAVVVVTQEDAGAQRALAGVVEGAEALGWSVNLTDARGDPANATSLIQQAVAQDPDGIVLIALEAQLIENGLETAVDAGIPVSCVFCWDLEDEDAQRGRFAGVTPNKQKLVDMGYATGLFAYEEAEGDVRAIMMSDPQLNNIAWRQDGFRQFIDECATAGGSCEVLAESDFLLSDLTTTLPQQAASVARANPDWNVFEVSFDFALQMALNGLDQAGLTQGDRFAVASNGDPEAFERIRNGGFQRATVAIPLEWSGWGGIDNLNRAINGEGPVDQNEPIRLFTEANAPSDVWQGDVDFRAAYRQAWGRG